MRVRLKHNPEMTGVSDRFSPSAKDKIVVLWDNGEMNEEFVRACEVFMKQDPYRQMWIGMVDAFRVHALIKDNFGESFREPLTTEEKAKGWYLKMK